MGLQLKLVIACALVALFGCGQSLPRATEPALQKQEAVDGERITGTYLSLGNEVRAFESTSRPLVVFLVSDSCSTCRSETSALKSQFHQSGLPENVVLLSLLVGAILEDASDWQASLGQQWEVGLDLNNDLFDRYCPERRTPCTLVQAQGKITKFVGETTRAQLEGVTGQWKY